MKKLWSVLVLSLLSFSAAISTSLAADFTLTSTDFLETEVIAPVHVFNGFGCDGGNLSPALSWTNAPEGTRSYAITVYDPDAPTGSGWWHWSVYNLPATTVSLVQGASSNGSLPEGAVQVRNDYGANAYGGPCPPEGHKPHHYVITVFALKVEKLELPADASPALVGFNLNANALAKASLTSIYGR